MIKNVGLQGIPPSAFYSDKNKHLGENLIRFCFMKVSLIISSSLLTLKLI